MIVLEPFHKIYNVGAETAGSESAKMLPVIDVRALL